MKIKTIFQCPVCLEALFQGEAAYFCPKGHSFDISRKGYVNLLLPNHKGQGNPGDSAEMVKGRRNFLGKGYYEGFSDRLNQAVAQAVTGRQRIGILDAGCGEGYYIQRLKKRLSAEYGPGELDVYGTDVSKAAVTLASGMDKTIRFAVASSYHLPLLTGSIDCMLCIFSPRDEKQFSRILKKTGFLMVAAPGPRHLFSLRKQLYGSAEFIGQKGTVEEGFELADRINIAYEITLQSEEDLANLIKMTPYYRHTDADELSNVKGMKGFVTEVDINLLVYGKKG